MNSHGRKKQIIVSADCKPRFARFFEEQGYEVTAFCTSGIVAPELSNHPDMFMCKMGEGDDAPLISYHADQKAGYPAFRQLLPVYPGDIAYNAACTGRFLIHNLKYTAPHILEYAKAAGMSLVNVKQGYAKCSTVIVDKDSIITYDQGIAKACGSAGLDVLTIRPGHILLPGYDTGFIGGTSGRIGNTICFNGDLSAHPDGEAIADFISERGLKVRAFADWPLTDIGSINCLTISLPQAPEGWGHGPDGGRSPAFQTG